MKSDTPFHAIERAVKIAGGYTALAKLLGLFPGTVHHWLWRNQQVSATYALAVEKAVDGQVTRHQLRPDLYPEEK